MIWLRRGLMAGALAGVWLSFADYGATWLWLPVPRDRATLLVRLLATLVPLGALLGGLGAQLGATVWRAVASRRDAAKLWPLPFVVLGIAPAFWLAHKLCSGGMMSRLAARYPLELGLLLLLLLALYVGAFAAVRIAQRLDGDEARVRRTAIALLVASSAAAKANQLILPNLYDYLHGLLALLTWSCAALGLGLVSFALPRCRRIGRVFERPAASVIVAALLAVCAFANASTLHENLNVRVAMFDARSPSSRALLTLADPLLRRFEQRPVATARVALDRERRTQRPASAPGAHVLLVTIDALRADHLGSYGYGRPVSPELDALAKEAFLFERAYAQAPHSSYSLSSLHTSAYVHELVALGRPLPEVTLARALRDHGYHTAAFFTDGIFHTEGEKLTRLRDTAFGFALFDQTNREAEDQTDRVLAEVARIRDRGEPPTLFWVHYFDVHEPYQETTFGSADMDRYDSEILHTDRELARLIRALRAQLKRPLVIAVSADHGEEFRDHGGVYHGSTLYDEQVRVPLIVQIPGTSAARVTAPVESIDIAPTLLAAVGAAIPSSMRGRDLRERGADRVSEATPVFSAVLTKRMVLAWPHKLIADLRFGLYELYDLSRDPRERRNLAGEQPERLEHLRGLVYGWLDSLDERAPGSDDGASRWERALARGRLGDRRAVADTAALLLERSAPLKARIEAGQILAKLADPSAVEALIAGLTSEPPEVAAEAAIALGRMYDERAREALRALMHVEDPHVRARAAVSLGRLRDRAAVPALIDALWVAPTQYEREEAVRWLGRLRDPAAVEPLLSLLSEFGLRYLIAVALGQIGDPRAYPALIEMLEWESRTNIRDEVVRGLGLLGDPRAISPLIAILAREPGLHTTAESLVRLGALARGGLGGVDVAPGSEQLQGFTGCVAGPLNHDWDYTARTYCAMSGRRAYLELAPAPRSTGVLLIVRARRFDAAEPGACRFRLGERALDPASFDKVFREQRWELDPAAVHSRRLEIECDRDVRLAVDHALLVPQFTDQSLTTTHGEGSPTATPK